MIKALTHHWPEYLMEAWGLGTFMIVASFGTIFLWNSDSPAEHLLRGQPYLQRFLMGIAMGITAIGMVYSSWGKRSGAHFNPALTLTFFRLGKIKPWDAIFYMIFQFLGAIAGVALTWVIAGNWISTPEVNFAITIPGFDGVMGAFMAEIVISFGMMATVLFATNSRNVSRYTGVLIGCLLVLFITFEAPFSGMSMNPARTVGSAVSANVWNGVWLYFCGPTIGMFIAAELFLMTKGANAVQCAKLNHTSDVRCIFKCGYKLNQPLQADHSNTRSH